MNLSGFLEDIRGQSSVNRLVFLLSYLVILTLMSYTVIIGDDSRFKMVESYAVIILPTVTVGKVTQRAIEERNS